MSEQLERFITLLKGIFELDKSDLDFGIYRIMNIRKKEIEKFLTEGLPLKVQEALKPFATDTAAAEARIKEIEMQLGGSASIAALPQTLPMVKEYADLKATLAKGIDLSGLEADVYSQLYSFFNRYYEEGDFISKRRYKEGVYAIPYEGEEVKLYWANQDQYYIKTSENFKDYTFVADDYTIHFKLVDATTEQNNNKESADSKRVFMLYTEDPKHPELKTFEFDAEKKEFIIRFIFDVPPEKKFDYASDNVRKIAQWIMTNCSPLVTVLLPNISNDPKKPLTLIEKHLKAYVAKNTFDYFIHKDLHKFLSRELDFYIKNEVMHLDDVDTPNEKQVETYLAKIRAIKRVGNILIEFLSSIENFQKKLWLKKKFVVQCDYCITLDRIPEEFYPEIWTSEAQLKEWQSLGIISDLNTNYNNWQFVFNGEWHEIVSTGHFCIKRLPKTAPVKQGEDTPMPLSVNIAESFGSLMADTKFFSDDFKFKLLACFDNFDEQCNGLLVHSENFQTLNLLKTKYSHKVSTIYLDPPYNTEQDRSQGKFLFKDSFAHSSWLTMMQQISRLNLSFLSEYGSLFISCDENELLNLGNLLFSIHGKQNFVENICWNKRIPKNDKGIGNIHEYILLFAKDYELRRNQGLQYVMKKDAFDSIFELLDNLKTKKVPLDQAQMQLKKYYKEQGYDRGITLYCELDPNYQPWGKINMSWPNAKTQGPRYEVMNPVTRELAPIPQKGWRWKKETFLEAELDGPEYVLPDGSMMKGRVWYSNNPKIQPSSITYLKDVEDFLLRSIISVKSDGSIELDNLGLSNCFDYPKPPNLLNRLFFSVNDSLALFMDYFGGSGTTAHSLINLNREDNGKRKYILVEMGEYFNTVMMPRIKKIVFSPKWEDGKPQVTSSKPKKGKSDRTLGLDLGKESLGYALLENGNLTDSGVIHLNNPYNGVSHCFKYLKLESYEDALSNVVLPDEQTTGRLIARFGDEYLVKYMLDLNAAGSVLNLNAFADPFGYKLKVTEKNETKEVNVDLMETFNYLIGLTVEKLYARNIFTASPDPQQGEYEGAVKLTVDKLGNYTFRQIEGKLPDGKRCLIIWRNVTENLTESNAALDAYFLRYRINPADREYDIIYVNGDNNLENLKTGTETWKVQMIEPEFKKQMFEEE